jgi:glutamyl-tRNA(Gln) amidotransferase subunit D
MADRRVLVVVTGGPGAFVNTKHGIRFKRRSAARIEEMIKGIYPRVSSMTDLDVICWNTIDSSQMIPAFWSQIAVKIASNFLPQRHSGVLVLHGSDTLAYTATALSFMLRELSVPVVLTAAVGSIREKDSAINNIVDSLSVAAKGNIAEVCIVSNHRIIRGTRARKVRLENPTISTEFENLGLNGRYFKVTNMFHHFNAFESINESDLGVVEFERPRMFNVVMTRRSRERRAMLCSPELEPKVALLKLYPGFEPAVVDFYVDRGYRGVVLESLGDAGIRLSQPLSVARSIRDASESGVTVVVCSQVAAGSVFGRFETFQRHLKRYCVLGYDMLPEVAYIKLMWLLAKESSLKKVSQGMLKAFSHEVTPEYARL